MRLSKAMMKQILLVGWIQECGSIAMNRSILFADSNMLHTATVRALISRGVLRKGAKKFVALTPAGLEVWAKLRFAGIEFFTRRNL